MEDKDNSFDYKTFAHMSVITARALSIQITAVVIAFISANLFVLIVYFIGHTFNMTILFYALVILAAAYLGCLLIKLEYTMVINKDLRFRPPGQLSLILITTWILLYFATGTSFVLFKRDSAVGYTVISFIALIITMVLFKVYLLLFTALLKLINKLTSKNILDEKEFIKELTLKIEEANRYARKFSLILLSFTIAQDAEGKIKNGLILPLFYNFIKSKIRSTDILGILAKGRAAAIISNNNDLAGAEIQATRLVKTLKENKLMDRKLHLFKSEYKYSICEFTKDLAADTLIGKAQASLQEALKIRR